MPMVPKPITEIVTLIKVVKIACLPSAPNQRSVETFAPGAKITEALILTIADKTIITKANNFMAINLPIKILMRLGWRTNKLRSVP
ncbi:unannotated protein [freshwater metagenome]|uniref:Unannotated protein n=1 Tax=freshwater metagenome TaxID=449393 RepID=A0A6J7TD76_9ZZZZ